MKKATKKASVGRESAIAPRSAAPAPEKLGNKRTCPKCATKFYDFEKPEIRCPKCDAKIDPDSLRPALKAAPPAPKKKVSETDSAAEALSTDESSTEVIESVDDLGDDGDVSEEIEVDDDDDKDDF